MLETFLLNFLEKQTELTWEFKLRRLNIDKIPCTHGSVLMIISSDFSFSVLQKIKCISRFCETKKEKEIRV